MVFTHIDTTTPTYVGIKNAHAHRSRVRDRRRGEEHRMDGVSPWKWTADYHGDCVGHVIVVAMATMGKLKALNT